MFADTGIERIGKCPVCGNSLIIRHGKFGDFVGCITFPSCRYSENLVTTLKIKMAFKRLVKRFLRNLYD